MLPHAGCSVSLAPRVPRPGGGQHPSGAIPGPAARPSLESHHGPALGCRGASPAPGGATDPDIRRGCHDHRNRPGVSSTSRNSHAPAGLGAGREWSRGGGDRADPSGAGRLPSDGGDKGPTGTRGLARRGIRPGGADLRGAHGGGQGAGNVRPERGALVGSGAVSAQGRTAVAGASRTAEGGGSLLPAGPSRGSPPAGQVVGAACGDEPGPAVAAAG